MSKKVILKSWSRSSYDMVEISHVWTVEKFSARKEKILYSSIFSSTQDKADKQKEWRLRLHPYGDKNENKGFLSVYLIMMTPGEEIEVNYFISLQDDKGNLLASAVGNNSNASTFKIKYEGFGFPKMINRAEILGKLPNDILKIKCDFSHVIESQSEIGESPKTSEILSDLSDSYGALLTSSDNQFCDVTLSCIVGSGEEEERTEFRAHRVILAARCPYFEALFKHDFRENIENLVQIKDVKPEIFKEILAFIYAGKWPKDMTQNIAKDVLIAADRFALDGLKTIAENVLISKLSTENASEMLDLAQTHSAKKLMKVAMEYVVSNLTETTAKVVLAAADRFALMQLKTQAENFLISKLTVENASELLIFAETHSESAKNLKTKATNFVAANLKEVVKTPGWDDVMYHHPDLTKELILKASMGGSGK